MQVIRRQTVNFDLAEASRTVWLQTLATRAVDRWAPEPRKLDLS
jgi:hypothetical protein